MSPTATYDALRHFADSYGLAAMVLCFVTMAAWPFRPGAKDTNEAAARMIFEDDDNGK